jgi:hypothetical protein
VIFATNPFVGPRSYEKEEAGLFYGRDEDLGRLLDQFIPDRVLLMYSVSGAGKTSLIKAKFMSALQNEHFNVLPLIRVSLCATSEKLSCSNRYVLSTILSLEKDLETPTCSEEELVKIGLPEYLDRREQRFPKAKGSRTLPTALVFDQFEEVVTLDPTDTDAKQEFFRQLGEALRASHRWALFAMREEWVAELDPYAAYVPTRFLSRFRLEQLSPAAATAAIQKPAASHGVEITDDAVTHLVNNLRLVKVQGPTGTEEREGPCVEAVQLQVVCRRLWTELKALQRRVTLDDVKNVSVDSALADYYADQVTAAVATGRVTERTLRLWFDRELIINRSIRGQVMETPGTTKGLSNKLIGVFVDGFLVRREERRGATWYELAHDRLIRPISDSNGRWLLANRTIFEQHVERWKSSHHAPDYLLIDRALDEANDWAKDHPEELDDTAREFLKLCERRQLSVERRRLGNLVLIGIAVMATIAAGGVTRWSRNELSDRMEAYNALSSATALKADTIQRLARRYSEELDASEARDLNDRRTQRDVLAADGEMERLVRLADQSRRASTFIDYRSREADQHKVNDALRELGFTLRLNNPDVVMPTNEITYGADVPIADVQLVAVTLMRAGVMIQRIAPSGNPRGRRLIQIHATPNLVDPPWTLERIRSLDRIRSSDTFLR